MHVVVRKDVNGQKVVKSRQNKWNLHLCKNFSHSILSIFDIVFNFQPKSRQVKTNMEFAFVQKFSLVQPLVKLHLI